MDAIRSTCERRIRPRPWREWPIWELPRWVVGFIALVVLADAIVWGVAAGRVSIHAHDLGLIAGLLLCSAATVELTRRVGENLGPVKDVYAVWELPVAMLLPLAYVPVLPAVRFALAQWRILRVPVHRRVFSAAAIGLSYVAAALVFHLLIRMVPGAAADPAGHALAWMPIVAVCAAVQWTVNQILVWTAIKGANPAVSLREEQFAKEPMHNDISELCVAVLVTFCVAYSWIALVFAFPFITLLQRSVRHARLLQDARADSKTGLLNAATWERQATAEVGRAVRTRTSLAFALLDIDRFKGINDTYGHLTGDEVLKEIAHTLNTMLREYDLAGRFGGEEFAVLLPQTRAVDAFRIAERIRSAISGLCIIAPGATVGERVHVTVSIGVAALDAGSKREYAELMAAADAALYRAKDGGRDQVQMISTTRGLSAVSSIPHTANGDGHEPNLFRRALLTACASTRSATPPGSWPPGSPLPGRSAPSASTVPQITGPGRSPVPSAPQSDAALCIFMRYNEYSSIEGGREGHMGARVAVAGASGYAGGELLRLLVGHPDLEIGPLSANSSAGTPVTAMHPQLTGHPSLDDAVFAGTDPDALDDADLLFTALPHGESAQLAARLPSHLKVIDLGADFRLADQEAWAGYYSTPYAGRWTYGLPELPGARDAIRAAATVAAPGCYATAAILALAPLLAAGLAEPADIVIVAASGTSGAGRSPRPDLLATEVMGSMSAYQVGGTHRHTPEIEQTLFTAERAAVPAPAPVTLSFTPTLAPMARGILATCTARSAASAGQLRQALRDAYGGEPFVHVLSEGRWPATGATLGSNAAHLQVAADPHAGRAVVVSALDNLVKGAAGQAIQIANLMLGLPETAGLTPHGVAP